MLLQLMLWNNYCAFVYAPSICAIGSLALREMGPRPVSLLIFMLLLPSFCTPEVASCTGLLPQEQKTLPCKEPLLNEPKDVGE